MQGDIFFGNATKIPMYNYNHICNLHQYSPPNFLWTKDWLSLPKLALTNRLGQARKMSFFFYHHPTIHNNHFHDLVLIFHKLPWFYNILWFKVTLHANDHEFFWWTPWLWLAFIHLSQKIFFCLLILWLMLLAQVWTCELITQLISPSKTSFCNLIEFSMTKPIQISKFLTI